MIQTFVGLVTCFVTAPLVASSLYYDAPSGELFLEAFADSNQRLAGYAINSKSGKFRTEEYLRLGGATDLFQLGPTSITEGGALVGGYSMGLYGLGAVLPTDLTRSEIEVDLSGVWAVLGESRTRSLNVEYGRPDGIPRNAPGVSQVDRWATQVTLTYFAPTGELVLRNDGEKGGFITLFHIAGMLDPSQSLDPGIGGRLTASPGEYTSLGLTPPGEYLLGSLLPPGLGDEEYRQRLDKAIFAGLAGVGVSNIDLDSVSTNIMLAYVPEPATNSLFLVAIFGGLFLRASRTAPKPTHPA